MRRSARSVGWAFVAVLVAAVLSWQVSVGPTVSLTANTLLVMGGNGNGNGTRMNEELSGYISGDPGTEYAGYRFEIVPWSAQLGYAPGSSGLSYDSSQAEGVSKLAIAVSRTMGPDTKIVVVGYSSSANVVSKAIRALQETRDADLPTPSPDDLSFIVFGNPNRPNGGIMDRFAGLHIPFPLGVTFDGPTPKSDYKVTDIAWQYDGYADFPKDTRNLLAVANALIGIVTLHGFYYDADPSNPDNILSDVTVDNTRYITLRSSLPLLAPLYGLGIPPQWLRGLDTALRAEIEKAYDRTVAPTTVGPQITTLTRTALRSAPSAATSTTSLGDDASTTDPTETVRPTATSTPDAETATPSVSSTPSTVTPTAEVAPSTTPSSAAPSSVTPSSSSSSSTPEAPAPTSSDTTTTGTRTSSSPTKVLAPAA